MASSSTTLPTLQAPNLKSHFLGRKILRSNPFFSVPKQRSTSYPKSSAKFNLFEALGGRGLCKGEKGIEEELKKTIEPQQTPQPPSTSASTPSGSEELPKVPEDGFDKELMGLTGGFPGGETGLRRFVEKNPPPEKAPESEVLVPGSIAIVKNPDSPFYMYRGVVQRIGEGKAGVVLGGGNWDRLVMFRLEELERGKEEPPAKNLKSGVVEALVEKDLL